MSGARNPAGASRGRAGAWSGGSLAALASAVGMLTAWLVDREQPTALGFLGSAVLILGVATVVIGPRMFDSPVRNRS